MAKVDSARRVLVTGASGFAGHAVVPELAAAGYEVRATARSAIDIRGATQYLASDLLCSSMDSLVEGMDTIVHLAARAHILRHDAPEAEAEYMRHNLDVTLNLALAAQRAGVRHFVFSSSIKAMGESTYESPFTETSECEPVDAYGRSKLAAERALEDLAGKSGISVTILRPPLMYGPRVRGNLLRLLRLIDRGVPLPLGGITNSRSMLGVRNFASAICAAVRKPGLGARVYLVCDGAPVSTPELLRKLSAAFDRGPRLFKVPPALLSIAGRIVGHRDEIARLTGSLVVDDRLIRGELDWSAPYSFDQGLAHMVKHYVDTTQVNHNSTKKHGG